MIQERTKIKRIYAAALAALFAFAVLVSPGCGGGNKPPARKPQTPAAGKRPAPRTPAAEKKQKTEAPPAEPEEEPDLIEQAGFDMIYPNFNRKTGRRDPFVPVSVMEGDWETLKRMAGEKFRVIGTAMTPSGQISMIEVGEQTKIVREGDVLENGSVVKKIGDYDVVLERNGRELRLTMFTRKRIAKIEPEEAQLKIKEMDNINDLYKQYLDEKYGNEYEGEEGETSRPPSFNEYIGESDQNKSRGPGRRIF